MTTKEAYKILLDDVPNMKALKCFEYDSLFVFQVVSKKFDESSKNPDEIIDCLRSVNKTTKEVRDFKPFYISMEEYRNGKEVKDFE